MNIFYKRAAKKLSPSSLDEVDKRMIGCKAFYFVIAQRHRAYHWNMKILGYADLSNQINTKANSKWPKGGELRRLPSTECY